MPILRKALLFFLTITLGLLSGVLIRFAFGSGLRWESAPRTAASVAEQREAKTTTHPAGAEQRTTGHGAVSVRLQAVAARDFDALARLMGQAIGRGLYGGNHPDVGSLMDQMIAVDAVRSMEWVKKNIFGWAAMSNWWNRWRNQNPAAAEAWAAANEPEMLQRVLRSEPLVSRDELAEWLKSDPARVTALLSENGPHRENHIRQVADLKAKEDPAGALTWAQTLSGAGDRGRALSRVMAAWATTDPAGAAVAWKSLPRGEASKHALNAIVSALPQKDALTWLRGMEPSPLVLGAYAGLLLKVSDPGERAALLNELTNPPGGKPDAAALRTFATGALRQAVESGSVSDAVAALQQAARLDARSTEDISKLFERDATATQTAFQSLPEGGYKTGATTTLARHIAKLPESQALQTYDSLPEGALRDATARHIAMELSESRPVQALDFIGKQSPAARAGALPTVISQWLRKDAAAASAAWEALPETDRRAAGAGLAERIAWDADAAGATLLASLPESPPAAYKEAAFNWVAKEPEAASSWVNTLPPGANRDAAASSMSRALTSSDWDPERAVAWAGSIGDAAMRLSSLRTSLELWALRDPAGAAAARQSLNAADQQALASP